MKGASAAPGGVRMREDSMHTFETKIQELKTSVLTEVARLAWEDRLTTGILDVPERIIPGPTATLRCCIYKERAIINSRVKMAMGGDKANPLATILSAAMLLRLGLDMPEEAELIEQAVSRALKDYRTADIMEEEKYKDR